MSFQRSELPADYKESLTGVYVPAPPASGLDRLLFELIFEDTEQETLFIGPLHLHYDSILVAGYARLADALGRESLDPPLMFQFGSIKQKFITTNKAYKHFETHMSYLLTSEFGSLEDSLSTRKRRQLNEMWRRDKEKALSLTGKQVIVQGVWYSLTLSGSEFVYVTWDREIGWDGGDDPDNSQHILFSASTTDSIRIEGVNWIRVSPLPE